MNVPSPGIKTLGDDRIVTETKRTFEQRFILPFYAPVLGEVGGAGIVVAAYAEDGKIGGEAPGFQTVFDIRREFFGAMEKIAQHQKAKRTGLANEFAHVFQIAIEHGAGDGNSRFLEDFRLAPMRIGYDERFLFVPVEGFASEDAELLVPYFC